MTKSLKTHRFFYTGAFWLEKWIILFIFSQYDKIKFYGPCPI